jgi:hypothetical protein
MTGSLAMDLLDRHVRHAGVARGAVGVQLVGRHAAGVSVAIVATRARAGAERARGARAGAHARQSVDEQLQVGAQVFSLRGRSRRIAVTASATASWTV